MRIFILIFVGLLLCAGADAQDDLYYLDREPFIHPRIIQEFASPFPLDSGDQVVAINLLDSQDSDRFFGDIKIEPIEDENPLVCFLEKEGYGDAAKPKGEFCYQYIGETSSGLHVVFASDWYGGSGVFRDLVLVKFEEDQSFSFDWDNLMMRKNYNRLLIKKMGLIPLGDRYSGELAVDGNDILIGEDNGWFSVSGGTGGGWLSYDRKNRIVGIEE